MLARLLGLGPQTSHEVWFARDIRNSELQHWMLAVKNRKFELARMPEGDFIIICTYEPGWTVEREGLRRSRGAASTLQNHWYAFCIGWSEQSGKEIDRCFVASRAYYTPRLSWAQSQDFLRRFVEQLVDRYDIHWQFFVDNTAFDRQSTSQLPRAAPALLRQAARVRQAQQARAQQEANFRAIRGNLNAMGASIIRGERQEMAQQQQMMQAQSNSGIGWGN